MATENTLIKVYASLISLCTDICKRNGKKKLLWLGDKNKTNADAQLAHVKVAGFDTYMVQIGGLYKIQVGAYREKTNADNMMTKLKTAGFDAFITTESGTSVSTLKSIDEIAREVIRGDWGNGADRRNRLISAGYDYTAVQAKVNELLG